MPVPLTCTPSKAGWAFSRHPQPGDHLIVRLNVDKGSAFIPEYEGEIVKVGEFGRVDLQLKSGAILRNVRAAQLWPTQAMQDAYRDRRDVEAMKRANRTRQLAEAVEAAQAGEVLFAY